MWCGVCPQSSFLPLFLPPNQFHLALKGNAWLPALPCPFLNWIFSNGGNQCLQEFVFSTENVAPIKRCPIFNDVSPLYFIHALGHGSRRIEFRRLSNFSFQVHNKVTWSLVEFETNNQVRCIHLHIPLVKSPATSMKSL